MRNTRLLLFFLILFCLVSGGINFFHVENGFATDYDCPACLFQSTFFAPLHSLMLVIVFVLTFLIVLRELSLPRLCRGNSFSVNNKSPPTS